MDLYFINARNLDNPTYTPTNNVLFNFEPFFNDYYTILYLKKIHVPKVSYKPILINDPQLIENYGGNHLETMVSHIIATGEQIKSYTYKMVYRILVLSNGWWCVYIEKRHIWDRFQSIGILNIMSPSRTAVLEFFQKHFASKLVKGLKPKYGNKITLVASNDSQKNSNSDRVINIAERDLLPKYTPVPSANDVVGAYFT